QADVDNVATLQKTICRAKSRPCPVLGSQHQLVLANLCRYLIGKYPSNQRVNVRARLRWHNPIRMLKAFHANAAGDDVEQVSAPAVPPLIRSKPIEHSPVRSLLQIKIERGVDFQPCLMHLVGAEPPLQLAPDFLDKPWCHAVWRRLNVQSQRS